MKNAFFLLLLILVVNLAWAQPLWPEEVVVRDGQDLHYYGDLVSDAFGNSLASWVKSSRAKHTIYADLKQPNGSSLWDSPVAIRVSSQPLYDLQVHYSNDNCFIFSWLESGSGQSSKIMLQKLSASGMTLWGAGVTVVEDRIQTYYQYDAAANSLGGVYVFYRQEYGNVINGRSYDSTGTGVWGANAPEIIGPESLRFNGIASRENYGVVIHYRSGESSTNFVTRYSEAGYAEWQQSYPYEVGEESLPHELFVQSDHSVIDAVVRTSPLYQIKIRMFSSQGTAMLNPPLVQVLDPTLFFPTSYVLASDGLGLSLLYTFSDEYDAELRYLQFPSDFTNAYPLGGVLVSSLSGFACKDLKLSIDNIGRVYCGWIEESTTTETLKVNMVNSNLEAAWGQGISILSSDREIGAYGLQQSTAGLMALYQHENGDSRKLTMQSLNTQGELQMGPSGQLLAAANKGTAIPIASHPLGDCTLVFFYDQDEYNTNTLYYQLINSNGYPDLPQALRLGQADTPVLYCKSCTWENAVAVIYTQGANYYLQVIGNGGQLNISAPGMYITNQVNGEFKLNQFNSDLYLGWMRNSSPGYKQLVGQCFRNWQWAWGNNGKLLVDHIPATDYYMGASDGGYFTWKGKGPADSFSKVYCLLTDGHGDPFPGWNPNGELVYDNPQDTDQKPIWAKSYNNSLIMLLGGFCPSSLFAVRVNIDHSLPWGAAGVQLADNSVTFVDCAAQDNGFWTIMGNSDSGQGKILLQYVNTEGEMLFEAPGNILQSFNDGGGAPMVKMSGYDNGRLLAMWQRDDIQENNQLYYQTINLQGEALEDEIKMISQLPGTKTSPYISVLGNEAVVAFRNDNYDLPPGYEENFMGIFAQKINGNFSEVPVDPVLPPANLCFKSCYPNPFSSSATLLWEQKDSRAVTISIYNLKGQKVKEYTATNRESGEHSLIWNGEDDQGRQVASGIYFIRLNSGKEMQSRKMVKF